MSDDFYQISSGNNINCKRLYKNKYENTALQIRAGEWSITANLSSLTPHIYHVIIIVTGGFSKKFFYYFYFRKQQYTDIIQNECY